MVRRPERLVASHALSAVAMAMPWPALLAAAWATTGSELWLAVVGGARMAPYVLLSWAAGGLGDRYPRTTVVKVSTALRLVLLGATAALLATEHVIAATAAATLAVAAGTPAYPALAAGMPQLAGRRAQTATRWLVTLEVSAFVVGPALGGLLLGIAGTSISAAGAVVVAVAGAVLLSGLAPETRSGSSARVGRSGRHALRSLLAVPSAIRAIVAVAVVNGVIGALGVGLLTLAQRDWSAGQREFGLATAALGFGALATPVVCWMLRLRPTAILAALVLTAVPLAATALVPSWWWALAPLALVGAGATQVECAVTAAIQESVPDDARSFALGVTDTAMVSIALVGAAAAAPIAGVLGARGMVLLLVLATGVAAAVSGLPKLHQIGGTAQGLVPPDESAEAARDVRLGSLV